MVQSNEVTQQFATRAFIIAWLLVICILQVVGVFSNTTNMQNQLDEKEAVIESYVEELTENQSLLDTEIDKNAQLSATIAELETQLSDISNELAALEQEKVTFEEAHKDCRPPIGYSKDNVLVPSNLTGEELSYGLLNGLKPYADCFVEMEEEYGINAIFLASVAALESGWCSTNIALNNNNLFGYKNSNGDGFRYFSSKEESIRAIAKHLKNSYLTEGGVYFNGLSIADINVRYCEQMDWAGKVDKIANGIIDRINDV